MTTPERKSIAKTVSFSKQAVNVFFHILTQCNLKCRHCYINYEQHGKNMLDLQTIKKWLETLSVKSEKANVIFLGGEPTLHPQLPEAVRVARFLGYASVTIDTNGYLFHDITDKLEPDEVDFFSFSLDGATRFTNDDIRGEGCYDACITGIRKAKEKGFGISLIYTVSRANLNELEQMIPLLTRLGVDRFFIQVIGIRGNPAKKTEDTKDILQLSRKQWLETVPGVARQAAEKGIVAVYPKVFLEPGESFECAGRVAENYFIFPNGRVYRCPICEDFPLHGLEFENDILKETARINESDLFLLDIPEGCVMNKLVQPDNISYTGEGKPEYKIACCLLKEEVRPAGSSS